MVKRDAKSSLHLLDGVDGLSESQEPATSRFHTYILLRYMYIYYNNTYVYIYYTIYVLLYILFYISII